MSSISCLLLEHLDDLEQDDFNRFKWTLRDSVVQYGARFSPIPRSKLEKAKQHDVVDLMVNQYGPSDAANITIQVLKQIKQNKLAMDLEKKLKDQVQAVDVESVSSASSSQAAGTSQNISADRTSSVHAPVLSGGTYQSVTMNFINNTK